MHTTGSGGPQFCLFWASFHLLIFMASEKCPVDHSARSTWGGLVTPSGNMQNPEASAATSPPSLSTDREISSIPRTDTERWVYPSQAQFFAAMARKNHNPHISDMPVV